MNFIQTILSSKKLQSMIATVLLVVLNDKLHLGIDPASMIEIVSIVCMYVVGQGIADQGKEAAKINNAASTNIPEING